jgi:hypothetical protein
MARGGAKLKGHRAMATAPTNSCDTRAGGPFEGDPFCTRGLREALERLERQIGRIGEIASDKDLPAPDRAELTASETTTGAIAAVNVAPSEEPELERCHQTSPAPAPQDACTTELALLRASLTADLEQAHARRTAAEQRAEFLGRETVAALAQVDDLSRQVATLQEALRQREEAPAASDAALHKQVTAMQAELKLLRKERDQLMSRLQREETRLQQAGITIEWAEPQAKARAAKTRRRSSG